MNEGTYQRCVVLEDVTRAALKLQSNGRPVTTRSVREELGRGSYSTISRLLGELGLRELEADVGSSLSDRIRLQAVALAQAIWRAAEGVQAEKGKASDAQWRIQLSVLADQLKKERKERQAVDSRLAVIEGKCEERKQEIARLRGELRRRQRWAEKRDGAERVESTSFGSRRMSRARQDRREVT